MSAWPAYGTVTNTTSAAATAWVFSAPPRVAPPSISSLARRAASSPRSSERDPITTSSPARDRCRASPNPRSPVPPTMATVIGGLGGDRRVDGCSPVRVVLAECPAEGVRDLPERRPGPERLSHGVEEVLGAPGGLLDLLQGPVHGGVVPVPPQLAEALHLPPNLLLVQLLDLHGLLGFRGEPVHPHHDPLPRFHSLLEAIRGLVDLVLDPPRVDRLDGAAHPLDLGQVLPGTRFDLGRQVLDEVRAPQRVDGVGHAGLVGDELLGAKGDPNRLLGGKGQRLVERVRVERLGPAQNG